MEGKMKYVVTYKSYGETYQDTVTTEDLKRETRNRLDIRGWDNKHLVDMRSDRSMIKYVYENLVSIQKVIPTAELERGKYGVNYITQEVVYKNQQGKLITHEYLRQSEIPEGWTKMDGVRTNPRGFERFSNNESLFELDENGNRKFKSKLVLWNKTQAKGCYATLKV